MHAVTDRLSARLTESACLSDRGPSVRVETKVSEVTELLSEAHTKVLTERKSGIANTYFFRVRMQY